MGSTAPAAIDALVSMIKALPSCQPSATPPAEVADGFPGPNLPDIVISVGGIEPIVATGTRTWAGLGARRQWEEYLIHGAVSAYTGGDAGTPEAASDAQKRARDEATVVTSAIEAAVKADPTLQGSISALCGWAIFEQYDLEETTAANASLGRNATVKFAVKVKAQI